MIKKPFLIFTLMIILSLTGFSKPVKVKVTYNIDNVTLIYNDVATLAGPKKIMIDFELGGQLVAFRSGYESQVFKISSDNIFTSLHIKMEPLENKFKAGNFQVELKKTSFINFVTNFTQDEVTDIISSKLNQCNISAVSPNNVFRNARVDAKKYAIGTEVVKSNTKNAAYTPPYYLLSHQKIKWYVLDNTTNNLLLELTTEGVYMAYFKANRGMVASDRLKEITVFSLEEAVQKFINSPEFTNLIRNDIN